jgi:IclR family pca regulon transcriptional regulator
MIEASDGDRCMDRRMHYRVGALVRGMGVLSLFDSDTPGLDLAAIRRRAGLAPATALRTVCTLCDLGYLEAVPGTSRYQPSLSTALLGRRAIEASRVIRAAVPRMMRLSAELQATVNIGVMLEQSVYYVWRFKAGAPLGVASPTGARLPAYCTSAGKLLLAYAPEPVRTRYLQEIKLAPRGPNTITDPRMLARELERVARRGYAIQDQEFASGFRSVAAPIRSPSGVIEAALNVAVPTRITLDALRREIAPRIVATARESSQALTGDSEDHSTATGAKAHRRKTVQRSRYHVAALAHGLEVLKLLCEATELRQMDIARALALSPATVHRITATLVELDALQRDADSGRFRLSLGAIRRGYSAVCAMELSDIAAPILHDLYGRLEANVHLGVIAGNEIINVLSLRRTDLIPMHGQRFPTYCTATGKVWLADLASQSKSDLISHLDMKPLGPNTHTSAKSLMRDLDEIRRCGYSVSDEEIYPGICGVGAPIRGGDGRVVAGVAASVLKHMNPQSHIHNHVAPLVVSAAARISERLLFRIDDNPILGSGVSATH